MKVHLNTLAIITGFLGLAMTGFMALVYYFHLLNLPANPIDAVRYEVSAHSTAAILLVFSLAFGLTAIIYKGEHKSSYLMLISTFITLLGYVAPCERLLKLGYVDALEATVIFAFFNTILLLSSALALHQIHKASI